MFEAETLTTLFLTVVGLCALALSLGMGMLSIGTADRRSAATPSDSVIKARVDRLAALGELPPGWSKRDAVRLLRVRARRARLAQ